MRIDLLPPDPYFSRRVEEEGWLDDPEVNHLLGYGRGVEGQVKARKDLLRAKENGLLVVYRGGEPVGWVSVTEDPEAREVKLQRFMLAPEKAKGGEGAEAVALILQRAFGAGAYRVSIYPLAIDREAIRFFQAQGFQSEGKLRAQTWMEGEPHGITPMSILATEWEKRKKEK